MATMTLTKLDADASAAAPVPMEALEGLPLPEAIW